VSRKRGHYEDSDFRYLLEKNKTLERKARSLVRENNRLKKERSRAAEEAQDEMEKAADSKPKAPAPTTNLCSACGSANLRGFDLDIRGIDYRYVECVACGKRSRARK
jgi:DNA-directed RNA polymerase subunit M/transcription elongation factor TFIIS